MRKDFSEKKIKIFNKSTEKSLYGGKVKTSNTVPVIDAPVLLSRFRKGREEFGAAASQFVSECRKPAMDAASEECLELLDHLAACLRKDGELSCEGLEDACIFLLEHLATRLQEQQFAGKPDRKLRLIQ